MKNLIQILTILILLSTTYSIYGQKKKLMTPDVYSQWNKIKSTKISDNGETIIYTLEKEIGDKQLIIYLVKQDTSIKFDRIREISMDKNGQFVCFTHGAAYDEIRSLKRKKVEKKDLPIDSLTIFNTKTYKIQTIEKIGKFQISSTDVPYLIYSQNQGESENNDQKSKKNKNSELTCKFSTQYIQNLNTNELDSLSQIKSFVLASERNEITYCQCVKDSTSSSLNIHYRILGGKTITVDKELKHIDNLSIYKKGGKIAYLYLNASTDEKQKKYSLNHVSIDSITDETKKIEIAANSLSYYALSPDRSLTWSESGNRLFFGASDKSIEQDTNILDDEIVNVEIWHHNSPKLYTQQESSMNQDKKKNYLHFLDTQSGETIEVENNEYDLSILNKSGDAQYIGLLNSKPYQKQVTWEGNQKYDLIVLDTKTKERKQVATNISSRPALSPTGKFLYWWSHSDSIYYSYEPASSLLNPLGIWSTTVFHDELNDEPQLADSYGIAGWTKDDETVLVYDRYDIWRIKPNMFIETLNLTEGRSNRVVSRLIKLNEKEDYIDLTNPILLHQHHELTKYQNYKWYQINTKNDQAILQGPHSLSSRPTRAKNANSIIFTKENFSTFPDFYISNDNLQTSKQFSDANPQASEYAWGKSELITFKTYKGRVHHGMLFYPADFDPEKKYPLIVNFYDRSSDGLYRNRAPEAHRSTINYSVYTNNGYFIFNPDIIYTEGQPGEDCVEAVESGVDHILKNGYIDDKKMGLQGHSWGGYQIAYLLTKTGRYACAAPGAPVVNMISAYGGIRWESGMSRMFQYEKAQSRLGATLWDNPTLYLKNSPIFDIPKITTPVLILHNDADGAVPWYQGIEFYMAMRRLNKPAWLLNYNDEPHWPVKWQNRLDFNIRMQQYFDHFLQDKPMPLWMKEGNTPIEKGILKKYE